MGFNLKSVNKRLYVDCDKAFRDRELDVTDPENPVLVVNSGRALMPISKDLLFKRGRAYQLEGIVVHAPATGKVYVPMQAVKLAR
jgi:alkaline phosphatase